MAHKIQLLLLLTLIFPLSARASDVDETKSAAQQRADASLEKEQSQKEAKIEEEALKLLNKIYSQEAKIRNRIFNSKDEVKACCFDDVSLGEDPQIAYGRTHVQFRLDVLKRVPALHQESEKNQHIIIEVVEDEVRKGSFEKADDGIACCFFSCLLPCCIPCIWKHTINDTSRNPHYASLYVSFEEEDGVVGSD